MGMGGRVRIGRMGQDWEDGEGGPGLGGWGGRVRFTFRCIGVDFIVKLA